MGFSRRLSLGFKWWLPKTLKCRIGRACCREVCCASAVLGCAELGALGLLVAGGDAVSNGGFGSNMAALVYGVPLVTAGTREGKNDNNVRLAVNRLAIDVRTETPKPARVRAAVRQALNNPDMFAAVKRIQTELATYDAFRTIEEDLQTDAAQRRTDHHPTRGPH